MHRLSRPMFFQQARDELAHDIPTKPSLSEQTHALACIDCSAFHPDLRARCRNCRVVAEFEGYCRRSRERSRSAARPHLRSKLSARRGGTEADHNLQRNPSGGRRRFRQAIKNLSSLLAVSPSRGDTYEANCCRAIATHRPGGCRRNLETHW